MTIVEFFDRKMLENVAGALTLAPQHVVLVGNNKQETEDFQARLHNILASRKIAIKGE